MIWLISLLVLVGALMLVVELVLVPGVTLAAIGALCCYGGAAWLAWSDCGPRGLLAVVAAIIVLSVIATWFSLRAKTWQHLALGERIEGRSQESPRHRVKVGDSGVAQGRLAPMGTVSIEGRVYEAKTSGEFVDPHSRVEVTGFENSNIIVKQIKD